MSGAGHGAPASEPVGARPRGEAPRVETCQERSDVEIDFRTSPAALPRAVLAIRALVSSSPRTAGSRYRRRTASRPLHRRVELAPEGAGAERRSAGRRERPLSQGRRRVATGAARVLDARHCPPLDAIPFDQLSPEEKVNAQVFRTSIRALANDVRFRTYEAPFNSDTFFWTEFTPRQGFGTVDDVPRISGAPPRRAALLRRADRQHAGGPRARLYRPARVRRRARQDDRAVREGRHDQPAVRAVHADALDHRRERSDGTARAKRRR